MKRALLSVFDKSGISELARFLHDRGVEILSTGGTATHLREAGVPVTPISQWTGSPEILGGRVKTLTPKVFGGILHDRGNASHVADCEANAIGAIDLVVVNLYPFEATIAREGVSLAEAIEQIDVGGPSMLRAAAKNHSHVLPLCNPSQYAEFMSLATAGEISAEFGLRAAAEVFRMTADYDRTIAEFLSRGPDHSPSSALPSHSLRLDLRKFQDLRYGENPQQTAAFYVDGSVSTPQFEQLQGKELSYNNLLDLDAATSLASAFAEPACAIIKHTNPCGTATAATLAGAASMAIEADPVSVFGGIVAVNRELDGDTANVLATLFLEVILAPQFSADAIEIFGRKKNLRLVRTDHLAAAVQIRSAAGGFLVQSTDVISEVSAWKSVASRNPSDEELKALEFAWVVSAHVKSNAIVLARGTQTAGIGAGQMSRVDSARLAITKAILPTAGSVAASDAFFPFRDGLDILADAGITAVVQPGGSVRDEEVIAAANERNLAMMFTGERHFRH